MPNLASALKKAAIEKRLAIIANLKPAGPAAIATPGGQSARAITFPLNRWVDILGLVDTDRDRVNGNWSSNRKELVCEPGDYSRIELPVVPEGGYDLAVDFTRSSGKDDIETMLPISPRGLT